MVMEKSWKFYLQSLREPWLLDPLPLPTGRVWRVHSGRGVNNAIGCGLWPELWRWVKGHLMERRSPPPPPPTTTTTTNTEMGPWMGCFQCHMSILRNAHIPCQYSCNFYVGFKQFSFEEISCAEVFLKLIFH